MSEFLSNVIAFPTVLYTGALLVALVYWLFVIIGALDIDMLDFGGDIEGLAEGGAEAAFEGAADAALEGAAEAALDGAADAALEGIGDAALDGAADAAFEGAVDGAPDAAAEGALQSAHDGVSLLGLLGSLGLRKAPVTVVLSLIAFIGFILSYLGMELLGDLAESTSVKIGVGIGMMIGSFLLSIPLTALAARPMASLFVTHGATRVRDILGQTATLTTGGVDRAFGQARVGTGGEEMLIQVRCDRPNELGRHDEVLIVGWDRDREAFTVEDLASARAQRTGVRSRPSESERTKRGHGLKQSN